MTDIRIGDNIRRLREEKNYTQQYIADKLKLSRTAYGAIERNESKRLTLSHLTVIALTLGVPVTGLFFDKDPAATIASRDEEILRLTTENHLLRSQHYYADLHSPLFIA
jgi:transcriptional regulator with XRE-family HTH domain